MEWDEVGEKWWFSIADVCAVLTDSVDGRKYWSVLKTRLKKEGCELTTICSQLKMQAVDGKFYKTDVADTKQILRLIQSICQKRNLFSLLLQNFLPDKLPRAKWLRVTLVLSRFLKSLSQPYHRCTSPPPAPRQFQKTRFCTRDRLRYSAFPQWPPPVACIRSYRGRRSGRCLCR
jgi:hypothetical protein